MNKQKDRCEGRTSDLDAKVLKEKLPTMPLFCIKYSSLSNKRAGWNKMCRLENWAKFGKFENPENLNVSLVDRNYF